MKKLSKIALPVIFLLGISLGIFVGQCTKLSYSAETKKTYDASWNNKMKRLYLILADLLTDVSNRKEFFEPKNKAKTQKKIENLKKVVSRLKKSDHKKMGLPDSDPTLHFVSDLFFDRVDLALSAYKNNEMNFARNSLKSVTGFCISCHTRNQSGPQFSKLALPDSFKNLSLYEKAEFFAATRQNERALENFEKIIENRTITRTRFIEWDRSVRHALAITVRVKKDPKRALKIVNLVLKSRKVPVYLKENAKAWKKSIQAWQKEIPKRALTEEGLFQESQLLLTRAKAKQKYLADRNADVYYLRASAVAHELLQKFPKGPRAQEGLLILGQSYQALRDLDLWSLHESYFEACVHQKPHSKTSAYCYRLYEESVFQGFSGSGGLSVPKDVVSKLQKLELKALPK